MADLDIIREIDDDLRREKLLGLWKYLSRYIIGISVVVVTVTVGVVLWNNHSDAKQAMLTSDFTAATQLLEQEKFKEAAEAFADIRKRAGHGGVASMAALREGFALWSAKKLPEARAVYQELAEDGGADPAARNLATLLVQGLPAADGKTVALGSVSGGDTAPFLATWAEFTAAQALEAGKPEEALMALNHVKNRSQLPTTLQARLAELEGAALSRQSRPATEK